MRYAISLLLLTGLSLAVCPAAEELSAEERLQFADGLYARGMYRVAAPEYEAFLEAHPDKPSADAAHFRLGECYRQMGDLLEAQREFGVVFSKYPESEFRARAGFKRASIFKQVEQYDAAIELYRLVQKNNPPEDIDAASEFFAGECLAAKGRDEEARAAFRTVITKHKASSFRPYALLKLAEAEISAAGKRINDETARRAIEFLDQAEKAADTDRVRAEAVFQRAEIYFRRGEFADSASEYQRLLNEFPEDKRTKEARLQAGWAAHNAGRYADALRTAETVLREIPELPEADEWLYLKANCQRQLVRNEEAVATYRALLSRFPESRFARVARYEKALANYRAGNFEQAIEDAGAVQDDPEMQKDAYWVLAESYAALKEDDRAVQFYRLIVREYPDTDIAAHATYRLAYHLQMQEDFRAAAQYYRQVAATWPKADLAPRALFASAVCRSRSGDREAAIQEWSQLVDRFPDHSLVEEALYQRAMEEVRLDRHTQGIASLEALLKQFPESDVRADAFYWEGMLYRELGRLAEAEDRLRRALDSRPDTELEHESRFYLAVVLHDREQYAEAAELLHPLLSLPLQERLPPSLLEWLAVFDLENDAPKKAMDVARVLVREHDEPGVQQTGWGLLGRAQLAAGNTGEAEKAFTKCLEADARTPFAAEAALHLAEMRLDAGKPAEAEKLFSKASKLAADEAGLGIRARAYIGLARSARALDNLDAAARYYMSVAILYDDPDVVPECLYKAAEIFSELGDYTAMDSAIAELSDRYADSEWTDRARKELIASEQPVDASGPPDVEFGTPARD